MIYQSSTIIARLLEICVHGKANALAYWYFDFNDKDKQSVDNLLRSLVRQLVATAHPFPEFIRILGTEYKAPGRHPDTKTLAKILAQVIAYLSKEVYVVIDALDECPEEPGNLGRQELLDFLQYLDQQKHERLHVLVTSRREHDIQSRLREIAPMNVRIEDCIFGDVELFIEKRLKGDTKLSRWSNLHESITAKLAERNVM